MNVTISPGGALNLFIKPSMDFDQFFITMVLKFSTKSSDNFDVNFMNKTIDFCKLVKEPRYEPLIKLGYKIFSEKTHLPQRCPIKKVVFCKL